MTRAQELDALRALAERLGPHTYTGPWLTAALPQIAQDIASDIEPRPTLPGQAWRDAETIVREARETADRIVTQARETAARETARARADVAAIRANAADHLERLAAQVNR